MCRQSTPPALSSCLVNRRDTELPWNNGLCDQICDRCRGSLISNYYNHYWEILFTDIIEVWKSNKNWDKEISLYSHSQFRKRMTENKKLNSWSTFNMASGQSSNRFTQWLGLEGTSRGYLVQLPCSRRAIKNQVPKYISRWLLSISKDWDTTISVVPGV